MATKEATKAATKAATNAATKAATKAAAKAATPWGLATVVDEVKVAQRAGEKRFASLVQLLEDERGELVVRFAYSTGGTARRGPVTLRARDIERLRAAVKGHAGLAQALGWGGDA